MTHRLIYAVLMVSFSLMAVAHMLAAQDKAVVVQHNPKAEIRHQIDTYMQSIDNADAALGATVWSPTPEVTFINPLGHERGWDEIAAVVYGKLMGQTFTKRALKVSGEVSILVYGDAAVGEFDWDFVAILRSDGTAIHTTGRESQVYVNLPGNGWRLVHVHYSGPPVAEAGQGF